MLRKIRLTFFGSCLPDRSKVSAKTIILTIKDAPLDELRQTLTDEHFTARDEDGITPVLAACMYGREDVLAWLVTECKQSLYIRDNNGNGPVELAIKHGRHGIVQQLYLPTLAGGLGWTPSKDAALKNFPYDRDTALNAASTSIMYFFADNPDFQDQLNHPTTHVMELDLVTQNKTEFKFGAIIAKGSFGKVSCYQAGNKVKLVKTPHTPVWQHFKINDAAKATFSNTYLLPESFNSAAYVKRIKREYKFTCLANPEYGPYSLQLLLRKQGAINLYSYAIIMSVIPGSYPSLILKQTTSALQAAKLILRIIETVHRLHQEKQIIHGDIRDKNILVIPYEENDEIDYDVILIDFGFAYRSNKRAVPFVIPANDEDKHVAPERINQVVDAHTSQDVWSVGTILEIYVASEQKLFAEVFRSFPSIELFITVSRCNDFRSRPTLADFIKLLKDEIEKFHHPLRCSK